MARVWETLMTRLVVALPRPLPSRFLGTIATEGGRLAFSFLTGVIVARELGPEGRGEFAVIILWPTVLAAAGNLGIRDALIYYQATGRFSQKALNTTALLLALGQSTLLVALGWFLIPYLTVGLGTGVGKLCQYFLAFIPLNLVSLYMLGLVRGRSSIHAFNGIRLSVSISYLCFLAILLFERAMSPTNVTFALLAANLVTALLALAFAMKQERIQRGIDFTLVGELFSYGIRNHLGSVSSMFNQRLDQMLMALILSPVELGWYVVAVSSSGLVSLVSRAVSVLTFPNVAAAHDQEARGKLVSLYSRTNVTGTLLIGMMLIVLLPFAIPLVYTQSFSQSILPAEILVGGTMLLAFGEILKASFQGAGRPIILAKAEIISLVVTIVGLILLLPWLGIVGAAIVSVLAYGTSLAYLLGHVEGAWSLRWAEVLLPMTPAQLVNALKIRSGT